MTWSRNGNTFYADTASTNSDSTSYINEKDVVVIGIIYACDTSGDTVVLSDLKYTNATYQAGNTKFHLNGTSKETIFLDLFNIPIRFPNGVWINSISANSDLTLILGNK